MGNIVLVLQAPDRQDAGQYVCPVGGHMRSGESELEALRREAAEEIGTTEFGHRFLDRYIHERHVLGRHENHYFIVYQITLDPDDIVLGPESVSYRTFTPAELKAAERATPELFAKIYLEFLERCHPELLA